MQELQRRQKAAQAFNELVREGVEKTVESRVEYNKDLEYNKHANLFAISYSTIHKAACDGSVNGIKYFMGLKTKPRIRIDDMDKFGICPIHYAAERGYDECIKEILSVGCPVDVISSDGMTAAMFASKGGKTDTLRLLFDHKTNLQAVNRSGITIAHFAAPNDFLEVFESLLVLIRLQKEMAVKEIENAEMAGDGPPPTTSAGKGGAGKGAADAKGSGKAAQSQKAKEDSDDDDDDDEGGINDNATANTASDTAGGKDEEITEAEKLQNRYRAMLNQPDSVVIDTPSRNGTRPLHVAATYNAIRVVAFLVDNGADVNAADSAGETALHKAARKNNFDSYKLIVSKGGNEHIRNLSRETARELLNDKTNV